MEKNTCKWCNKKIGHKINFDWKNRQYHKSCYEKYQDYQLYLSKKFNVH